MLFFAATYFKYSLRSTVDVSCNWQTLNQESLMEMDFPEVLNKGLYLKEILQLVCCVLC